MSSFKDRAIARLLIRASFSLPLFSLHFEMSVSELLRSILLISALPSSTPFLRICILTNSPLRLTSPTSKPLTPSTVTSSPFSKYCEEVFLKNSLRLPLLKLISTILQLLSGSLKGRFNSQSCTFIRLQPPVLQPPLLLHPLGLPSLAVPQLPQPISICK